MIALTGMPGSGKSTVAQSLGSLRGDRVYDTDRLLHDRHGDLLGANPSEAEWTVFRTAERQLVHELAESGHGVLALGGGVWMDRGLRDVLLSHCFCVYLRCSVDTLLARGAGQDRVMFRSGDRRMVLHNLLDHREKDYELAHLNLAVDYLQADEVAERIVQQLPSKECGSDGIH